MTPGEQRRKALELLAPPPSRRHECLRDIAYALDWVSGPARTAFKKFDSKEGRAGLRRYANALRRALAAYQNLHPRIRPWFSITETAYIVGQPTHLHRGRGDSRPAVVIITGRPAQRGGGDGV